MAKWVRLSLLGVVSVFVLAVLGLVLVDVKSNPNYGFLEGAEKVSDQVFGLEKTTGEPMAHQIVFNIKGEYDTMIDSIERELVANGWTASTAHSSAGPVRTTSRIFIKPHKKTASSRSKKYVVHYGRLSSTRTAPDGYISVAAGKSVLVKPNMPINVEALKEPWITVLVFEAFEDKGLVEKLLFKLKGRKPEKGWPGFFQQWAPSSWAKATQSP